MAKRIGTKNVSENAKFSIITMAKAKIRQFDIAMEFKLSKRAVSKISKKSKRKTNRFNEDRSKKEAEYSRNENSTTYCT